MRTTTDRYTEAGMRPPTTETHAPLTSLGEGLQHDPAAVPNLDGPNRGPLDPSDADNTEEHS